MKSLARRFLAPSLLALGVCAPQLAAAPKSVLVVTVTTGFRHSCIPLSEKVLEQLAAQDGRFTVDFVRQPADEPPAPVKPKWTKEISETPEYKAAFARWKQEDAAFQIARIPSIRRALEKLSPQNLARYDAVLFASTTGDLPLPDTQAFIEWVAAGHAFIGVHAAADTFHGFPEFIAMLGGEFLRHGPQVSVDCLNQDPRHAATRHLPASWAVFDEIYQFQKFERPKVHGLLALDKHPNDKTPGDYPVAWCKKFGQGRVFYTSLGHREDVWDPAALVNAARNNTAEVATRYQQHVLGGILWALGLAEGSSTIAAP